MSEKICFFDHFCSRSYANGHRCHHPWVPYRVSLQECETCNYRYMLSPPPKEKLSCAFVRGLWGNPTQNQMVKVFIDVLENHKRHKGERPLFPQLDFSYGVCHHEFLRTLGTKSRLLAVESIQNFYSATKQKSAKGNQVNWGLHTWHHKLVIMKEAFKLAKEIIWLDWDVCLSAPMPSDLFAVLRRGQPLQSPLRRYHAGRCGWREDERNVTPYGGWIYCREPKLIDSAIDFHKQRFPRQLDEVAFAYLIDQMGGGWQGVDHYRESGFQPSCVQVTRQVHKPQRILFSGR